MKKILSLALVFAMILAVCPVFASAETTYSESPVLAGKVSNGELPPVEERLPSDPQVLEVAEVGTYGGLWRQATPSGTFNHAHAHMTRYLSQSALIYDRDHVTIIPNWISSFEHNDDYTEFTFKLRDGLKWSDGEPVTTEDVSFWYNDILKNTEYTASDRYYFDCTLDIVDELTWKFTFETTKPLYPQYWAGSMNSRFVYPSHYLKQYHPTYAEADALAATLSEEGYDDWKACMEAKTDERVNPNLPVLGPFVMTADPAETNSITFERNPYYAVVDQSGNQLPYLDEAIVSITETTDLMNMKIIAGEVDYQAAGLSESFSNYPMFAQYAEEMNYKLWTANHNEPGALNFDINVASSDAVKAPLLANVDFRIALALGIDRDAIVSTFYAIGPFVSQKASFSWLEDSPYYDEEWAKAYIDFDVETANAKLDELGMDQYDADGWRTTPDGESFDLVVLVPSYDAQWGEVAEMVSSHWRENLKLNINTSVVEPSLWGQRIAAAEYDITALTGTGFNGFLTPDLSSIGDWTAYTGRCGWGNYPFIGFTFDESAENYQAPSAEFARLMELGNQIIVETDEAAKAAELAEVAQIWKDGVYTIGLCRRLPAIIVVKNYVHNTTEESHGPGWDFGANGVVRADGIWFDAQ